MVGYNERELTELYGAPARFSEHGRGDVINFRLADGEELTGTIIWTCKPHIAHNLKMCYVVQVGNLEPQFVFPRDVLS